MIDLRRHIEAEGHLEVNTWQNMGRPSGIPPKSDFNAWYPAIVEIAELVDKRYPIKGMDVWRPYGWKAMRCIDALTHREMERTDHEEVCFPLLYS